ncbi:hypothetical protein C8F04DRAFT_1265797 [Mycena alexandri]|uniref:Uncharacterized protein n=1 Tax=Mycena alexandri TaxID=1745969 RepID=A0AAD6SKM2_9AGAR|nr:hypothetical protein C8F04DRAFT_1265797 [Mycena alexandri]
MRLSFKFFATALPTSFIFGILAVPASPPAGEVAPPVTGLSAKSTGLTGAYECIWCLFTVLSLGATFF